MVKEYSVVDIWCRWINSRETFKHFFLLSKSGREHRKLRRRTETPRKFWWMNRGERVVWRGSKLVQRSRSWESQSCWQIVYLIIQIVDAEIQLASSPSFWSWWYDILPAARRSTVSEATYIHDTALELSSESSIMVTRHGKCLCLMPKLACLLAFVKHAWYHKYDSCGACNQLKRKRKKTNHLHSFSSVFGFQWLWKWGPIGCLFAVFWPLLLVPSSLMWWDPKWKCSITTTTTRKYSKWLTLSIKSVPTLLTSTIWQETTATGKPLRVIVFSNNPSKHELGEPRVQIRRQYAWQRGDRIVSSYSSSLYNCATAIWKTTLARRPSPDWSGPPASTFWRQWTRTDGTLRPSTSSRAQAAVSRASMKCSITQVSVILSSAATTTTVSIWIATFRISTRTSSPTSSRNLTRPTPFDREIDYELARGYDCEGKQVTMATVWEI